MKKPKQRKNKSKKELTEAELKKLLLDAGFVFVHKKERVFGKPEDELHKGETIIYPEGSSRGFPIK